MARKTCPVCQKTFTNLKRHLERKYKCKPPKEISEEIISDKIKTFNPFNNNLETESAEVQTDLQRDNLEEKISRKTETKKDKKNVLKSKFQNIFFIEQKNIFCEEIRGWHYLTEQPINEKNWEIVNSNIFKKLGSKEMTTADGSHKPGMDIACDYGTFSNKTCKLKSKKYSISSYRLTTVCSDKNIGNIFNICQEISSRLNFEKYSILGRNKSGDYITYKWFLVPSKDDIFNPFTYDWSSKIGQQGEKKGDVVGWETNKQKGCKMDITFSMSSQLWLHIDEKYLEPFLCAEIEINLKKRPDISYSDIYNLFKNIELKV